MEPLPLNVNVDDAHRFQPFVNPLGRPDPLAHSHPARVPGSSSSRRKATTDRWLIVLCLMMALALANGVVDCRRIERALPTNTNNVPLELPEADSLGR